MIDATMGGAPPGSTHQTWRNDDNDDSEGGDYDHTNVNKKYTDAVLGRARLGLWPLQIECLAQAARAARLLVQTRKRITNRLVMYKAMLVQTWHARASPYRQARKSYMCREQH